MMMAHSQVLALFIARCQFAFTVSVHIIFPAFSIGLAVFLAFLEAMWLKTRNQAYLELYKYWIKIFTLTFAMGVVSGIVMAFEFGTNWSNFSKQAGAITGVLLSYEVMTAFFMEAGFLGVMLFGYEKVGPKLHFFATCGVALGTLISMTWILSSNSWMQTPQGFIIDPKTHQFIPHDWWSIIFNPSFPYRLIHMGCASFLSVAFIVAATASWHLLRNKQAKKMNNDPTKLMLSLSLWMITVVAPLQIAVGDAHGLNTLKYQPAKVAALEGDWTTEKQAPELLFGIPNMQKERTDYKVSIPYFGSLILTHNINGTVPGLKDFPADQRAPSPIVFFSFRLMVLIGILMMCIGFYSLWLRYKKALFTHLFFLRCITCMAPSGFIALLCGWITTEVGRQPWTVYGLLRTKDSVSSLALSGVSLSMMLFVIIYVAVFGSGLFLIAHFLKQSPRPITGSSIHSPN